MTAHKPHCLPPRYEPTPADIAQACREIQAGWTAEDRQDRSAGREVIAWIVPGSKGLDARRRVRNDSGP